MSGSNLRTPRLQSWEYVRKEDFESFVEVQMSGRTNMVDTRAVCDLSGLTEDQVSIIRKNYSDLKAKFSVE